MAERYQRNPDGIINDFLAVLDKAELKDAIETKRGRDRRLYGFHSFRHGFASMAASAGVPIATLGAILGDNVRTLERYYVKIADSSKKQAVNSIMINGNASTQKTITATIGGDSAPKLEELKNRIQKALQWMNKSTLPITAREELQAILEDRE